MQLPPDFKERIGHLLKEDAGNFLSALDSPASLSIRFNPGKQTAPPINERVPWCENGYYLSERPSFTLDPLFHAGTYYVQEPSSMIIEQVFKQYLQTDDPLLVLDLCAAPGGKSTHFASLINSKSLLVANEVIKSRANILTENIIKWGTGNVIVTNNDPKDFSHYPGLFDVIFIDAPCSGEGLFRKDPNAVNEWSPHNLKLCSERQQRILHDIIGCLKPGGLLIYSTCTYNPTENEDNIDWLAKEYSMDCLTLGLNAEWGIKENKTGNSIGYYFYPHKVKGEGLFISVMQKTIDGNEFDIKPQKEKLFFLLPKEISFVEDWINKNRERELFIRDNKIELLPAAFIQLIQSFHNHLHILYEGIEVGQLKKNDVVPSHSLALYTGLNKEAFSCIEVSKEDALKYLRKEEIKVSANSPGWKLITYKEKPLGWIKHLGNRINNYYPTEWRIRMKG